MESCFSRYSNHLEAAFLNVAVREGKVIGKLVESLDVKLCCLAVVRLEELEVRNIQKYSLISSYMTVALPDFLSRLS